MDALIRRDFTPAEMVAALQDHPARIDVPPEHYFAPGLYARKVTLPAGTFAIGEMHRTTHISVLAKGSLVVRGVNGLPDHRMVAGDVMVTPTGSQRAVYAEEDSVFVCIHFNPHNVQDLAVLKMMFVDVPALENAQ